MSRNRLLQPLLALACALLAIALVHRPSVSASAATTDAPQYAANGDLLPLPHYREWVYLTSGIDMSYAPRPQGMQNHSMFDNVFVNPAAWHSFQATGAWPDKTVLVLEVREARNKGSINQSGHFQGTSLMGFEVHVKDTKRFPGGWAFFDFDAPDKNGTLIPTGAPCYSCHRDHGAVDSTFVQFYPTLLPIAQQKKTLTANFLKETDTAK